MAAANSLSIVPASPGAWQPQPKLVHDTPSEAESNRHQSFEDVYLNNNWGSPESRSGTGSTIPYTSACHRPAVQLHKLAPS